MDRELTDGVEDASIAMYENVTALAKLGKKERNAVSQCPAARQGFRNTPCPAVRIPVDVD